MLREIASVSSLTGHSAFDGVLIGEGAAAGIIVAERRRLSIVTLMTLEDQVPPLSAAIERRFNCPLPVAAKRCSAGGVSFLGIGPATWLAVAEASHSGFVSALEDAASPNAWVADQSDGLGVLRLSGPHILEALSKGVQVDLHPESFRTDDVAVTSISHIGATLWKVDDAPTFDVAVFRSMAESFWAWLHASAAARGIALRD
jgi:sarcosine oxidase subunit gamma